MRESPLSAHRMLSPRARRQGLKRQVVLITGASTGLGHLMSLALAKAGHVVYASMRGVGGKNSDQATALAAHAKTHRVDLEAIELDVRNDSSANEAVQRIVADQGRIDVLVHNAGRTAWGPAEAFTPEQLAALYDVNVIGAHRVNRAALPHMRRARGGLLLWIGSSSAAGGVSPMFGPCVAAKAAMDALAVSSARELAPFGIDSCIVVPGTFVRSTNHFVQAETPEDSARVADYEESLPHGLSKRLLLDALATTVPHDANLQSVARAVVDIVATPVGQRPFRVVVDPANDGAAVSYAVIDRVREEFLRRIGLAWLMRPGERPRPR